MLYKSQLVLGGRAKTKAQRDIKRKLPILNYAQEIGNVSKACRYFGIFREAYYQWKRA